jgi:hypothetical protein
MVCDETWLYRPGILGQLHKRTTKFSHNRKVLELSTGSIKDDETERAWISGTQRRWQFRCPECSGLFVPTWRMADDNQPGGVRWSEDAKTETSWNMAKVRASVYLQCPLCAAKFQPSEENGYRLNRGGEYTAPVDGSSEAHESFHWPAWVSDFKLLADLAVEWLESTAAIRRGTIELLKEFTQKREANAWDEGVIERKEIELRSGGYTLEQAASEPFGVRIMTVDVQRDWFWCVVRDWDKGPHTRMVWVGKILSWDQIREIQLALGVRDGAVFIDSGHFTATVYAQCCRFNWTALKGENAPMGFPEKQADGKVRNVPIMKAQGRGVPTARTTDARIASCYLVRISEELTADTLSLFRTDSAQGWTIADDAPAEYHEQMASRVRRVRLHPRTGQAIHEWVTIGKSGEHLHDCERYQIAAAYAAGMLIGIDATENK